MCLAVPARVEELFPDEEKALVSVDGVKIYISTAFLSCVSVGAYVLVHVGVALEMIDPEESEKTILRMWQDANGAYDENEPAHEAA